MSLLFHHSPANPHPRPALRRFKPLPRRRRRLYLSAPSAAAGNATPANTHNPTARYLFDEMPHRKAPLYAATITSHCRSDRWSDALSAFALMVRDGALPDKFLLPKILKACSETRDLHAGSVVHSYMLRSRIRPDVFVGNSLIDMYAKCGDLSSSRAVFDQMEERDVVSWTALANAYADAGLPDEAAGVFNSMRANGVRPDLISWNTVISAFARNGEVEMALGLLDEMKESGIQPGTNTWNGVVSGCVQNGCYEDALDVFCGMCLHEKPNAITVASILPACTGLQAGTLGKELHCFVIRNGIRVNVFVGGSLIDMYLKCGENEYAERVFLELEEKNATVWNEMIAAYANNNRMSEALKLVRSMVEEGFKPDVVTYNTLLAVYARKGEKDEVFKTLADMGRMSLKPNIISMNSMISGFHQSGLDSEALDVFRTIQLTEEGIVINSRLPVHLINTPLQPNAVTITSTLAVCTDLGSLKLGKEIHGYVWRNYFECNIFVSSSLVDMYAKCGDMVSATKVFDKIRDKSTVSWNILMAGHNLNGDPEATLKLLPLMMEQGFIPNEITLMILLLTCSKTSALRLGRELHGYIEKNKSVEYPVTLASSLIDMYAKCGSISEARSVFDDTMYKDIALWNTMMSGYSLHMLAKDAISLFAQMEASGVRPDHVTLTAILSACKQEGFVEEGWKFFNTMEDVYGVAPTLEHFTCMVDIMSSAGLVEESLDFIKKMPFEPDACVWSTLLKACRLHSKPETGEKAARALFELEPRNATNYIVLSNIFAMAGMWDSAMKVKNVMRDHGLKMVKACSWIYLGGTIHSFQAGDRSHPEIENVLDTWGKLADKMTQAGYTPHDVIFCDKSDVDPFCCYHTEKLAICLGITFSHVRSLICVSKNIRMCMDCHWSTKFISKIIGREIIVSDGCCYHRFKDGICSCRDKW